MKISNKNGFTIAEALGAVILLSIAIVTVTSSLLNSLSISVRNKQRVMAQTACEYYVNAIEADLNEDAIYNYFQDSAVNSVQTATNEDNESYNYFTINSSNANNLAKLFSAESICYKYYNNSTLKLNDLTYDKSNVSMTFKKLTRSYSGAGSLINTTIHFYTIEIEIIYSNSLSEVQTYEFFVEEK